MFSKKTFKNISCLALVCFLFVVFGSNLVIADEWKELMPCKTGDSRPCGSDIGICKPGNRACVNAIWGNCVGSVGAVPEVCDNGLDDDCDGITDECLNLWWIVLIVVGFMLFFAMWILSRL